MTRLDQDIYRLGCTFADVFVVVRAADVTQAKSFKIVKNYSLYKWVSLCDVIICEYPTFTLLVLMQARSLSFLLKNILILN